MNKFLQFLQNDWNTGQVFFAFNLVWLTALITVGLWLLRYQAQLLEQLQTAITTLKALS